MSPLPDIAHWWAIEAMIASCNHVYKVTYGMAYQTVGAIGVSDYGNAPIASFELELLAVVHAVQPSRAKGGQRPHRTDSHAV